MASGFYPKATSVMQRSIEVQRLVIPFLITHNATPASKVLTNDEPSVLFLQTQGNTQVTTTSGALDAGASVPPFDLSAADTSGAFNLLVNVNPGGLYNYPPIGGDVVIKIMQATVTDRVTGATYACYPNSSNPPLTPNADQMLLNCASGVDLATTDLNGCLAIEYTVHE